ncbi:PorP/SprF family type IX secretion system membrane protein [Hymenobacter terrenus]|uniref:hypothetical protein n=1 Tax=Hymenobacter terrenus TaxID=1629124 RepID=UPI000619CB70|nr:hypothetical protein [Hymenobacter terrenus]
MKSWFLILLVVLLSMQVRAQQVPHYTVWVDGLLNAQLPKSSFYSLGTGLRVEASRPLRNPTRALFVQLGYAHLFRKSTSAFTADAALLNVGYRYQSHRAFGASLGVGAQYWREQLRINFPDGAVAENLDSVLPSMTLGFGFRVRTHYQLGLENRLLLKSESGSVRLRDHAVLTAGYTF